MKSKRVAITGLGIFCSTGKNVEEFTESLRDGKPGIGSITLFDTSKYPCKIGAEIRNYRPEKFFEKKELKRLSRADQFALIASEEAAKLSGIDSYSSEEVGVCLGAGAGGMFEAETYHREVLLKGKSKPSLLWPFIPNYSTDRVAERFGFSGPKFTVTTACSSSATAIGYGVDLIQNGNSKAVLCGGSEALSELTFGGFNSLKAMDPSSCKPFDRKRAGMSLGEGAGIVILEDLDEAIKRGARIFAEFLGYGIGGEAYHITAPEPTGMWEASIMREALGEGGGDPSHVDYINAHGTGTPLNDKVETLSIKNVFGERAYSIPVSSIKSMVGHCLGAAGVIEAVASILSIVHQFIPPTLNHQEGDEDCDLDYVPGKSREMKVGVVLSNSFAFGGNCTTLVFRKYNPSSPPLLKRGWGS
ncbi:MAG TPA: beta-ketoacyl-[acyl-carrier-protein] synthase family protein [Thermodesulfobacteriota bacterium]|jgi:3-oxoacyl-[acyl-carrier-protein] synthase II|nr:beta-ketoacyl-[acyl-carrier-protein] synthase family protein [Thermodesulfobacteriota bacterium]